MITLLSYAILVEVPHYPRVGVRVCDHLLHHHQRDDIILWWNVLAVGREQGNISNKLERLTQIRFLLYSA